MEQKAGARQEKVIDALHKRRDTDIARAREIFAAFRVNLLESRDRLDREIRGEEEKLFADDQQRQRRRDLASMIDRLDSLDDEEQREIAAIGARYADIKPHVTAAAVVFALTPQDAKAGKESSYEPPVVRRHLPQTCTAPGSSSSTPTARSCPSRCSRMRGPRACRRPSGPNSTRCATPSPRSRRPGTRGIPAATTPTTPWTSTGRRGTPGWT